MRIFYKERANKLNGKNSSLNLKCIKPTILGCVIGICINLILLSLCSFLFSKNGNFPLSIVTPITICIMIIGSFFGGYFCAKISKKDGMLYGLSSGFIIFTIIFFSEIIFIGQSISMIVLVKLFSILLSSAIGGIIGVNKVK